MFGICWKSTPPPTHTHTHTHTHRQPHSVVSIPTTTSPGSSELKTVLGTSPADRSCCFTVMRLFHLDRVCEVRRGTNIYHDSHFALPHRPAKCYFSGLNKWPVTRCPTVLPHTEDVGHTRCGGHSPPPLKQPWEAADFGVMRKWKWLFVNCRECKSQICRATECFKSAPTWRQGISMQGRWDCAEELHLTVHWLVI